MDRKILYLISLLHDIANIFTSSKDGRYNNSRNNKYNYKTKYTNFIEGLQNKDNFKNKITDGDVRLLKSPDDINNKTTKILEIADILSIGQDKDTLQESTNTREKQLKSIFSELFSREIDNTNQYYPLKPLSLNKETIFPKNLEHINKKNYHSLMKGFFDEISNVKNIPQIYYLIEKYFWSLPYNLNESSKSLSLFEHSKIKAAVSICLFDQYKNKELNISDPALNPENIYKSKKEQFILIKGDLSGIQDFIFNIPTKGAGKSLKGRSMYIVFLTEIISKYILDKLDLFKANLLYNGGGNFYILAPKSTENKLKRIRKEIFSNLLSSHEGNLYCNIEYVNISPKNFQDFGSIWHEIDKKTNKQKKKKWKHLGLKQNYKELFGPYDEGTKYREHCKICGISRNKRKVNLNGDGEVEDGLCSLCHSFIDLTDKLKRANYLSLSHIENAGPEINSFQDVFALFGYKIGIHDRSIPCKNNTELYKMNNTDFLESGCTGFMFGAYNLPTNKKGDQITFSEIAEMSKVNGTGDQKLAFLKLDVDNLGYIFNSGFGSNRTISRITFLSRMFSYFFEGYLNNIIKELKIQDYIYTVFSGGDDTFIIGSWNKVLKLVKTLKKRFKQFTSDNPKVHFSAGLIIANSTFNLSQAAEVVENSLEYAKHYISTNEDMPSKNKIYLFGEIFNWEEYDKVIELGNQMSTMITKKGFSRSLLNKVYKSTKGFKKILEQSGKLINNVKLWRLAYYLKEERGEDPEEIEKLIEYYREIVIYNLLESSKNRKIDNIMIIPSAVKLAEMKTRK